MLCDEPAILVICGLRDYGHADQLGQEATAKEYVAALVAVFEEVRRVLRADGTLWLNIGDTYAGGGNGGGGSFAKDGIRCAEPGTDKNKAMRYGARGAVDGVKPKDLIGIPWLLAFALREAGWWLRSEIIWHKPNPMPESVTDRPTTAHEKLFLLAKSVDYHYDAAAISEPVVKGSAGSTFTDGKTGVNGLGRVSEKPREERETRNKRSVWTVPTAPYHDAHFATYPPALITPCILAGTKPGDMVLDPFSGSGTTGMVARGLGRSCTMIELNPDYTALQRQRTAVTPGLGL
jgi:DNA modification methylase